MEPEKQDQKKRLKRAKEWKKFRDENLFTQKRLADIIGVSRRTIQQIEAGRITPHPTTLRLFAVFKRKFDINQELQSE